MESLSAVLPAKNEMAEPKMCNRSNLHIGNIRFFLPVCLHHSITGEQDIGEEKEKQVFVSKRHFIKAKNQGEISATWAGSLCNEML